jgi:hypothetical protein
MNRRTFTRAQADRELALAGAFFIVVPIVFGIIAAIIA